MVFIFYLGVVFALVILSVVVAEGEKVWNAVKSLLSKAKGNLLM